MAVLSFAVVLGAAGSLFGPTRTAFASSVTSSRIAAHDEVVYGKTLDLNHPLSGAHVLAYHLVDGRVVNDAKTTTSRSGAYKLTLHRGVGKEYVQFRVGDHKGIRSFAVQPGRAYRVSGQFKRQSFLFFLPVFSY